MKFYHRITLLVDNMKIKTHIKTIININNRISNTFHHNMIKRWTMASLVHHTTKVASMHLQTLINSVIMVKEVISHRSMLEKILNLNNRIMKCRSHRFKMIYQWLKALLKRQMRWCQHLKQKQKTQINHLHQSHNTT